MNLIDLKMSNQCCDDCAEIEESSKRSDHVDTPRLNDFKEKAQELEADGKSILYLAMDLKVTGIIAVSNILRRDVSAAIRG